MKKMKKYLVLSLATCITVSPIAANAIDTNKTQVDIVPISAPIIMEESNYTNFQGEIIEITEGEDSFSIRVSSDKTDPYNGMVFHISKDTIILNDETKDFQDKDKLEKGQVVSAYYGKNTPMTMSIPAQLTPDVIVVKESENPATIHISNFNEDLVSSDNKLKLNLSEDTIIVDENGNKVEKEDIANNDLIVFYTISTRSIPAQTTPEKIVVMDQEEENVVSVLDKVVINEKEIQLEKVLYESEGFTMVPLRQITEELGYEVKWNNETATAEVIKGAQWTAVTIGEDNYSFAKMLVKLGKVPEIKDSSTYVPLNFLEEVIQASVEINEDGKININQ